MGSTLADWFSAHATLAQVKAELDGTDHAGRMAALATSNRAQQRWLFELAAASPVLTTQQLCAPSLGAGVPVTHHGRNTLPLPGAFRVFQKPMCRAQDGTDRLFGFNEGASRPLVGPGYFVAYSTSVGQEGWEARGGVVVDYFKVPDGPAAAGWPKVVPNTRGLQILVFNGTRDFLRGVSNHVTIGAAYKGEKALDHYFTLCRQDG